jgi:hypothetical protein
MLAAMLAAGKLARSPQAEGTLRLSDRYRALLAAALGFLTLPAIGYAAGVLTTGFFIVYYYMISAFGVILGLPLLLAAVSGRNRVMGLCLLAAVAVQGFMVTARGISGFVRKDAGYPALATMRALIPEPHPDIVVAAPALFLPLHEANRHDPEDSLLFLFDQQKGLAEAGTNTSDILYDQLRPFTNAHIEHFDAYTAAHPAFYLAVPSEPAIDTWQYSYLVKRRHAGLRWLGNAGVFDIFHVDVRRSEE